MSGHFSSTQLSNPIGLSRERKKISNRMAHHPTNQPIGSRTTIFITIGHGIVPLTNNLNLATLKRSQDERQRDERCCSVVTVPWRARYEFVCSHRRILLESKSNESQSTKRIYLHSRKKKETMTGTSKILTVPSLPRIPTEEGFLPTQLGHVASLCHRTIDNLWSAGRR
jgi:hypothetical protein